MAEVFHKREAFYFGVKCTLFGLIHERNCVAVEAPEFAVLQQFPVDDNRQLWRFVNVLFGFLKICLLICILGYCRENAAITELCSH